MSRDQLHAAEAVIAAVLDSNVSACVTCSFQAEGVVLLHMLREKRPDIPVLFLDTFHHFDETCTYRDMLAQVPRLRAAEPSPGLWRTSTDACCAKHKVEPLFAALDPYDVWFTGRHRDQSVSRVNLTEAEVFALPSGKVIRKINPLVDWSTKDVWDYANANAIPLLPLYDLGYPSIGCEPCTSLPIDLSNPRSGRWQGQKLECGIHLQPVEPDCCAVK
jgi:phosphoadenosine phosphosulfate reductase